LALTLIHAPIQRGSPWQHNTRMATPKNWDIFCKVIDNFGDIGVCWRLACNLAARGQQVRLWADDASALSWIAPQGASGVQVREWTAEAPQAGVDLPGDVVIEAFGCDVDAAWIAGLHSTENSSEKTPESIATPAIKQRANRQLGLKNTASKGEPPVWINLEYLSAEVFAERSHGLPSPVMSGPAAGMTKWFYYPGFTASTGGLLREDDLPARQAQFKPLDWLKQIGLADVHGNMHDSHGVADDGGGSDCKANKRNGTASAGVQTISLFCYEPQALKHWLEQLAGGTERTRLLVTHGRAAAAVEAGLSSLPHAAFTSQIAHQPNGILREQLSVSEHLSIHYLNALTQVGYDHLLWSCQFNCVRGEDSLVRALWAGQPFVWHIYPQSDGAHAAKLDAFLDWLHAPADLRLFHHVWNGLSAQPLPALDLATWGALAQAARQRLLAQADVATQLMAFADAKSELY
jgi:uncharacterized repeat protein (TIGR03837 family)